jgi:hypothetical protein
VPTGADGSIRSMYIDKPCVRGAALIYVTYVDRQRVRSAALIYVRRDTVCDVRGIAPGPVLQGAPVWGWVEGQDGPAAAGGSQLEEEHIPPA